MYNKKNKKKRNEIMSFLELFWKYLKLCLITVFAFAAFFGAAAGIALLMIEVAKIIGWTIVILVFTVLVILIIAGGSALIEYFDWR